MKKINIKREDLESFLEKNKGNYEKPLITFDRFKELFCNDKLNFSKLDSEVWILKKIYKKISSSDTVFYTKLRNYIIESFLKEYSYCPYCGKSPLIHFDEDNKKKRMFQFDHFFSKNHFHSGIINFYNLIPSCNACNHLKSDKSLNNIKVFHPYFWWIIKNWKSVQFLWDNFDDVSFCEKDINEKVLIFNTPHSDYFKINKMYSQSIRDTANVFDFIRDKETKIKDELIRFPGKFFDWGDAKKYFFENYYSTDKNEVTHYQNWKLKKDLIDNLEI